MTEVVAGRNTEEWRDIPGFNGRYQASTLGRIKAVGHPRRINHTFVMRPQPRGAGGYHGIGLWRAELEAAKSHFVHVLIAVTLVGPKPDGFQVNHIDFDKHNNRLSNLEYISPKENTCHALRAGRRLASSSKCLTPVEVRAVRRIIEMVPASIMNNRRIGKLFNTSHETIRQIRHGKRWLCVD